MTVLDESCSQQLLSQLPSQLHQSPRRSFLIYGIGAASCGCLLEEPGHISKDSVTKALEIVKGG